MIKYLQIANFCGLTDLRTGGLIVGYMSLAAAILNITLLGNHWITSVPELVVIIPMLYGIHKNREGWMLPAVIFYIFELVFCLLCAIVVIPVCNFIFWEETKDFIIEFARDWLSMEHSDPKIMMTLLWLALVLGTAIHWYFTAIIYSLYKASKHEKRRQSNAYNVAGEKA